MNADPGKVNAATQFASNLSDLAALWGAAKVIGNQPVTLIPLTDASVVDILGPLKQPSGNINTSSRSYNAGNGGSVSASPGADTAGSSGRNISYAEILDRVGVEGVNTTLASETQVLAKFAESNANRTYQNLDLTINERGLLAQERNFAEASGWKRVDGSTWYPPYDGAIPGTQRIFSLEPGSAGSVNLVDRFGQTSGTYVSPEGLPLESRALSYTPITPPSVYSIEANINGVERATIAPWFGQKGLGVQYKLPSSVQYYLDTMKLGEVK